MAGILRSVGWIRQHGVPAGYGNPRLTDQNRESEQRPDRHVRSLGDATLSGRWLGHPHRHRQPPVLELELEDRKRIHPAMPRGHQASSRERVERVVDGDLLDSGLLNDIRRE